MAHARMILGLAGTLAAFALALLFIDWPGLLAAFAILSAAVLLVSGLFSIATTVILAARWANLAARGQDRFGMQEFHDALVGQIFNVVTPAAVGGDAYRVVVARGRDGGRTRAMAMLVLERLMGFAGYAVAFLLAFAIGAASATDPIMNAAAAVFAGVLAALAGL